MLRFHSKAGADVLMLDAHAGPVLQALGRKPAPAGIFLPEQIAVALQQLDSAEHRNEPERQQAEPVLEPEERETPEPRLRQRAWPLRELLLRAAQAGQAVVWETL